MGSQQKLYAHNRRGQGKEKRHGELLLKKEEHQSPARDFPPRVGYSTCVKSRGKKGKRPPGRSTTQNSAEKGLGDT